MKEIRCKASFCDRGHAVRCDPCANYGPFEHREVTAEYEPTVCSLCGRENELSAARITNLYLQHDGTYRACGSIPYWTHARLADDLPIVVCPDCQPRFDAAMRELLEAKAR